MAGWDHDRYGELEKEDFERIFTDYAAFKGYVPYFEKYPTEDFGIKYNIGNGGPAPEKITEAIFARSKVIDQYKITDAADIDLNTIGAFKVGETEIVVFDPVADYAELMESLFDFDAIRTMIRSTLPVLERSLGAT